MQNSVTIYTTPTCVYCKMAKEFFLRHQIAFVERNVATDLQAREEMMTKSGQMGVPVITIDDQVIIGFNQPRLKEALGIE